MAVESGSSDIDFEAASEVSEKGDEYDEDMANANNVNADDEDYLEEFEEVAPSKSKRGSSKRKPGKRPKRFISEDDEAEYESVQPTRKRGKVARALHLEDEEDDEVEEQGAELEFDEEEPLERTEPVDQVEDEEELSDAASTRLPSTQVEEDDDARETTEDSLKRPTKSKMLQELLGDSHSRRSLTEEEAQLRRAENARKRKNLSEKRLEEEKQETINKLLRRRAGKSRSNLPKDDEPEEGQNDSTAFTKPRRPYNSSGMTRTLRRLDQDVYCTVADRPADAAHA